MSKNLQGLGSLYPSNKFPQILDHPWLTDKQLADSAYSKMKINTYKITFQRSH